MFPVVTEETLLNFFTLLLLSILTCFCTTDFALAYALRSAREMLSFKDLLTCINFNVSSVIGGLCFFLRVPVLPATSVMLSVMAVQRSHGITSYRIAVVHTLTHIQRSSNKNSPYMYLLSVVSDCIQ